MKFNLFKFKLPNLSIPKKIPIYSKGPDIIHPKVAPIKVPISCATLPTITNSATKSEVKEGIKKIGSVVATVAAEETLSTAEEAVGKYVNNYRVRKNSGYDTIDSLKGSYSDTVRYYGNRLAGKPAKDPIQAVYFDD